MHRLPIALLSVALGACGSSDSDSNVDPDTDTDPDTDSGTDSSPLCDEPAVHNGYLKIDAEEGADAIEAFCDQGLNAILGNLIVTDASTLQGLGCLCQVHGDLNISRSLLTDLDGLQGLRAIGGSITLQSNTLLADIDAMAGVQQFDGDIIIKANDVLPNLAGFTGLQTAYAVRLEENPSLTNGSGLSFLRRTDELLVLDTPLSGLDLSALQTIYGNLTISGAALRTLNVPALTEVTGSVKFEANGADLIGGARNDATQVGEHLTVRDNATLSSLAYLPCMTEVTYNVQITQNSALADLDGLGCMATIGGSLSIVDNPALLNVEAMHTLELVDGDLDIVDNTTLTDAKARALSEAIGRVRGTVTISGNGE